MSDVSWWDPNQCQADGIRTVCWSVHTSTRMPPGGNMAVIDSNVLYGDGHAVTRNILKNWVDRIGGNLHMY